MCASDQAAGEITADHQWIDYVVGILAVQGHSRVKAPAHLFGWQRINWKECPIRFHQTDAANHNSIINNGLCPGGMARYLSRMEGYHRWRVYASMADGHGYFSELFYDQRKTCDAIQVPLTRECLLFVNVYHHSCDGN